MRSNTRETMARRDNFKQSVIDILFKRSGGKCCKCRVSTFGPHTGKYDKYQNIGQAAHIAAAAPGGPRYEKKMAPEERTSAKNGLWLCSNCHSEVDKDSDKFTVIALRRIKKEGEERARREIGVAPVVSLTRSDKVAKGVVDLEKHRVFIHLKRHLFSHCAGFKCGHCG